MLNWRRQVKQLLLLLKRGYEIRRLVVKPPDWGNLLPWADGIKDYQRHVLARLLALSGLDNLAGLDILEIGADQPFATAKTLAAASGRPMTVVNSNIGAIGRGKGDRLLRILPGYFEEIDFQGMKFDLIIGVAVLEHIAKLKAVFSRAYDLLKPEGWALLNGGPMWRCHQGHHTYIAGESSFYAFSSQDCPVGDFKHLNLGLAEMTLALQANGVPAGDAQKIAGHIYHDEHLNRIPAEDIARIFLSEAWAQVTTARDFSSPPADDLRAAINEKTGNKLDDPFTYALYLCGLRGYGRAENRRNYTETGAGMKAEYPDEIGDKEYDEAISNRDRLQAKELSTDLAGGHLHLLVNSKCNMKCSFCYQNKWPKEEQNSGEMDPKWLYGYFRPLYERVAEIGLLGGEITIAREGFGFVKFLHENYPSLSIHVESNGWLWADKWSDLAVENLLYASFSVNAATPQTFARAVWPEGGEKVFIKVQENISTYVSKLREAGLKAFAPVITMVVIPETAHEVVDFVRLGLRWGCRRIHLLMDQRYSKVENLPSPALDWALRASLEMERVLDGKVRLETKLFLPAKPALRLVREVNQAPLAELERRYSDLLELAAGRNEIDEFEARQKARAERGKKPVRFSQDVISDAGHCFIEVNSGGLTLKRCSDPWNSLQIKPGGACVQCSWNYAYEEKLEEYLYSESASVRWDDLLNCENFKLMRLNILQSDYQGCMAGCPWLPELAAAYGGLR